MVRYLTGYIKSRVAKNQNFVMLYVGQTGTGKSYAAMSLAEELDPEFDISRIVFSADEFIDVLNNDDILTRGSVIIWDEAGVGMPAREWYSISNKVISYVVQTFRVKGYVLIMTTPSLKYIDSQIRALFHGIAETIDPSMYGGNFGWAKYMHLVHDPKEGKTMMQYPVIMDEHNRPMKLKGRTARHGNMLFSKPSEELIGDYEVKKKEFTDNLITSASDMMTSKEDHGDPTVSVDRIMDMVLEDPDRWGIEYIKSKSDWKKHVYAIFRTEHPDMVAKSTDIDAALHLIRHNISKENIKVDLSTENNGHTDDGVDIITSAQSVTSRPGRKSRFNEQDISTIHKKIEDVGLNQAARELDVSKSVLNNFRKKMTKKGLWPTLSGGSKSDTA